MNTVGLMLLTFLLCGDLMASRSIAPAELARLKQDEAAGIRYHKKGKFKKAYEKLSLPAEQGLKQAQYLLGFMYLRGDFVQRSIEEGLGWLGVANEIGVEDWTTTYNSVYQLVSEEQKRAIDLKVRQFIQLYGMQAQALSCANRSRPGSRRAEVICQKKVNSQLESIESQGYIRRQK